jgi:hypothetical protein
MWLVLYVVAKQTATTHSHVCLTLGVVAKKQLPHFFARCVMLGGVMNQTRTSI